MIISANETTNQVMEAVSTRSGTRLRVLIVDDSQTIRERLSEMLSRVEGLEVVGEADGVRQARTAIREHLPEIVILDLQMGDGNGLEILQETKSLHPSVRLVVLTNRSELQYRQRCLDLGADYFFCKSTDARSLIAVSEFLVAAAGNKQ